MTRRAALGGGILVGLLMGAADGVAVVLENPLSFPGFGSGLGFLAGAIALHGVAGAIGGAIFALAPARFGRGRPGLLGGAALAVAAFLALGVRLHVKWFFGVPLTHPAYAAANLALAAACAGGAAVLVRALGAPVARLVALRGTVPALAVLVAGAGAIAFALRPGGSAIATPGAPPPGARDVLLVTLDTTRADHLSTYGYPRGTTPALDRLARSGTLWERAYASIPLTNPSHASILTGLLPRAHGVLNNGTALSDAVPTFVPELAAAGWRCAAFVSGIPLKHGLSGLAPGFATYDDAFSSLERIHSMITSLALVRTANRLLPGDLIERRARDTVAAAIDWLRRTEGPRFLWVHVFDPHTPYDAPAVLRRRFEVESAGWTAAGRPVGEWPHADYDAELRETDRWIEDLLRAWDEATDGRGSVILTADHGEGLEQHGELTHGSQLFEEDVRVPCVWRIDDPRLVAGGIERAPREIRTIPRSVGWAAGLDGPPPVRPFEPILLETFAPEGKRDRSALLDAAGRKVIVDRESGEEVGYDLARDPGERRAVAGTGDPWDTLRRGLAERVAGPAVELDPETLRRLRSLGYLH
jgi:hypothetical protein